MAKFKLELILVSLIIIGMLFFSFWKESSEDVVESYDDDKILQAIARLQSSVVQSDTKFLAISQKIDLLSNRILGVESKISDIDNNALNNDERLESESSVSNDSNPNDFLDELKKGKKVITVSPTIEQNTVFENLKLRLSDPYFTQNLSMQGLIEMDEMKQLPQALQYVIMSKAVARYNNGEIDRNIFFSTTN